MQTVYTEATLKPIKKAELYEILLALGIDGVAKNASCEEMIALILANTDEEPPADDGLPKYSPEQLIKSSTYSHRRDVLRTLLDDDKTYSYADIARILKDFYEKEVK